jgi:ATP-dependent DNA helicase RecG
MAIETVLVTEDEGKRLLDRPEGHFLDFKSVEVSPAKLSKALSAFSNADGGELFVGADQLGSTFQWRGFGSPEDANGHLQCFEPLFPLGQHFSYEFLFLEGRGYVLRIEVNKNPQIVKASDSIVYLRRGAQSLPVTTSERLRRLELDKGLVSFETETVGCAISEVSQSDVCTAFIESVVPKATPEKWLRKQRLISGEKPTVAGVLVFSDLPQTVLPKRCAIKLYRYKTSDSQGSRDTLAGDPSTIEGCIYDQVYDSVSKTKTMIQGIAKLGPGGLEPVAYPDETLHEIITNAVLHRDYSLPDDVHVRVFDNRVEVESPGSLPGHITVDNILDERFARNGAVVRIINKFPNPPNKDVGEGLNTAYAAMTKLRLKPPQIRQLPNSVLVVIRHEPLASPEELVMSYLGEHESINNGKARELCHISSDWLARSMLRKLEQRGMIERTPGSRTSNTAYRLKR